MFRLPLSVSISCVEGLGLQDGKYRYRMPLDFEENLREIKRVGIEAVELCVCGFWNGELFEEYAKCGAEKVLQAGLRLNSVHFPFGLPWVDLTSPWERDRLAIIAWCKRMFAMLDGFHPKSYVFHPGGDHVNEDNYSSETAKLYDTATQLAEGTKASVCVENMVRGPLMETVDKVLEFANGAPTAGVTLDVNHLLQDKPEEAIECIGKRICALHISDYDFVNERHMLPKEGKIEWMKVLSALEKAGVNCAFNYELNMKKYGYTYAQIKDNYDSLFKEYNTISKSGK